MHNSLGKKIQLQKYIDFLYANAAIFESIGNKSINFDDIPIINKEFINDNYSIWVTYPYHDYSVVESSSFFLKDYSKIDKSKYLFAEITSATSGYRLRALKSQNERNLMSVILWKMRKQHDPEVTHFNSLFLIHSDQNVPSEINDVYDFSDASILTTLKYICEIKKPRMIHASPTILIKYANFIKRSGFNFDWKVSFIESNSEFLSDSDRDLISGAFGCKVVNHYGTLETWTIGYECTSGCMHVLDHCLVELIDSPITKKKNELIVTNTLMRAFPIFRYKVGDYATISYDVNCACGQQSPIIQLERSRLANYLVLTNNHVDGIDVIDRVLKHCLQEELNVIRIKAIQIDLKTLDVYFSLACLSDEFRFQNLVKKILTDSGWKEEINFQCVPVDSAIYQTGKGYLFVSKVKAN